MPHRQGTNHLARRPQRLMVLPSHSSWISSTHPQLSLQHLAPREPAGLRTALHSALQVCRLPRFQSLLQSLLPVPEQPCLLSSAPWLQLVKRQRGVSVELPSRFRRKKTTPSRSCRSPAVSLPSDNALQAGREKRISRLHRSKCPRLGRWPSAPREHRHQAPGHSAQFGRFLRLSL